jgi:peptide/nickel transport system substrate-binding protein
VTTRRKKGLTTSRREFLKLSGIATTSALLVACFPETSKPNTSAAPSASASEAPQFVGKYQLGKLEGPSVITDASKFPKAFKEAPELAALVQQGKLPPVAQRIGSDPIVVQPLRAIGKFGGTIRRGFNFLNGDVNNTGRFSCGPDTLLTWDYDWGKLRPNIAKSYAVSSDFKTVSFTLRNGMKWSNGDPVTTEDVRFWYEDIYRNPTLLGPAAAGQGGVGTTAMRINNKDITIKIVDDFTFQLVSPDPHPLLPEVTAAHTLGLGGHYYFGMNGLGGIAPSKYMKQFHPKYAAGGEAAVLKMATDAKFNGIGAFFLFMNTEFFNADCPTLGPWLQRKGAEANKNLWALDRNPYSVWVDTEGNQLPYINSIEFTFADSQEVINLRAAAGEYDVADRLLDMNKIPILLDNQTKGNYKIYLDPNEDNNFGLRMNWGYQANKTDPEYETFELLRTTDFRRALSLGIDRKQINEAFFLGAGTPGSFVPQHDTNKYFPGADAATGKWALNDVAQANKLLDGLGYTNKDASGFRLRKDGKGKIVMQYLCTNQGAADFPAMGEMLKTQWAKIGIDTQVNGMSTALYSARLGVGDFHFVGFSIGAADLFLAPGLAFQTSNPYNAWFNDNTKGTEPFKELKDLMASWQKAYGLPDAERIAAGKQWFQQAADICLQIGVVGADLASYGIRLAKTNVENIPGRTLSTGVIGSPRQVLPQTFFYK